MEELIQKYKAWKEENPDEGYQYDMIHDFFASVSRSDMQDVMEFVEANYQ